MHAATRAYTEKTDRTAIPLSLSSVEPSLSRAPSMSAPLLPAATFPAALFPRFPRSRESRRRNAKTCRRVQPETQLPRRKTGDTRGTHRGFLPAQQLACCMVPEPATSRSPPSLLCLYTPLTSPLRAHLFCGSWCPERLRPPASCATNENTQSSQRLAERDRW